MTTFTSIHLQPEKSSAQPSGYAWTDAAPITGDNYYRLKTEDATSVNYSAILHFSYGRSELGHPPLLSLYRLPDFHQANISCALR